MGYVSTIKSEFKYILITCVEIREGSHTNNVLSSCWSSFRLLRSIIGQLQRRVVYKELVINHVYSIDICVSVYPFLLVFLDIIIGETYKFQIVSEIHGWKRIYIRLTEVFTTELGTAEAPVIKALSCPASL